MATKLPLKFSELPQLVGGALLANPSDGLVETLITDSRKANPSPGSVFFAIKGQKDGHQFIGPLYAIGCRQFVVEQSFDIALFPQAAFIQVPSSIKALQKVAAHHRAQFSGPVIGITGSNGKTIVKEWIFQALSRDFLIAKSPGSYNSQLGVPLSVWNLASTHTLGLFEAGISKPGEMQALADVIQPTVGIFTNLGPAHDEGFENWEHKAAEKASLFKNCNTLIYCRDHTPVHEALSQLPGFHQKNVWSWGAHTEANVKVFASADGALTLTTNGHQMEVPPMFKDNASRENLMHVATTLLALGFHSSQILERLKPLKNLPMRLELKAGLNNCAIVDDSYSNDLAGLKIALDFLKMQGGSKKIAIVSGLPETGLTTKDAIAQMINLIQQYPLDEVYTIGKEFTAAPSPLPNFFAFPSTQAFLESNRANSFHNATILVKGARSSAFEKIVHTLQKKSHGTVMEINLAHLAHNVNYFRTLLRPTTKIMAMVKAFGYGSGSHEVANQLQHLGIDYLGVAYADEGKELRQNGLKTPILVMNPSQASFQLLLDFDLEPSIFSVQVLHDFLSFLNGNPANIHLKIDTGMHRLGFETAALEAALNLLAAHPEVKVKSVYSHLAASDEGNHDGFSAQQVHRFEAACEALEKTLRIKPLRHILNTSGIARLPQFQMDMVRLGIGMYGIATGSEIQKNLLPVMTLRTVISQIKSVAHGETVGYGRHGKSGKAMTIATLPIGYADGYSRAFGRGVGQVRINHSLAPVVGNVCMDMTMVDVTDIECQEGDDVIIFGNDLPVSQVADWIHTIPYELLTATSDRVKRVFFAES